jgi:hypothetical protein
MLTVLGMEQICPADCRSWAVGRFELSSLCVFSAGDALQRLKRNANPREHELDEEIVTSRSILMAFKG